MFWHHLDWISFHLRSFVCVSHILYVQLRIYEIALECCPLFFRILFIIHECAPKREASKTKPQRSSPKTAQPYWAYNQYCSIYYSVPGEGPTWCLRWPVEINGVLRLVVNWSTCENVMASAEIRTPHLAPHGAILRGWSISFWRGIWLRASVGCRVFFLSGVAAAAAAAERFSILRRSRAGSLMSDRSER